MMHFNGETWLRILILLCALIVSVSCLRGSELILHAAKAKQGSPAASTNATATGGEVSDAEGKNSTTGEKSLLTGIPQIDYIHDPNLPRELNGFNLSDYPFYNAIPSGIDFKCDGLHDGFYASVPHHCQVYHHCLYGIRYDFLCANYTAFDQKTFICHFVSEVDCTNSPKYYQRNEALYKAATSAPIVIKTTTTKATTEAPPKKSEDEVRRPGPYRHRRPPFRRRPAYEYYDNGEDYYDDYYYYGPPVRKRPNRNKGFRGDYYGGERAGGHKSIHRDPPRRKPLKPLYEEDDEEYEYYYDSADGSKDDDDRRRPQDNNYRKPLERDRPYQNKKRDKDGRYSEGGSRNDKKKRVEEEFNSRKNDDDKRLRNKYLNKSFASRSKYDRDEYDLEELDNPRRYQEDKRDKYLKNKSTSESPKRTTEEKPYRSKIGQKTTPSPLDDEEYDDIVVTPKWKSRFQANPRRPSKDETSKKSGHSREEDSSERKTNSDHGKDKSSEVTESSLTVVNPSIYARQPSKLYSQVKVETRPPQVQRNKDHYKADIPATTMSSYRRPSNLRPGTKEKVSTETERPKPLPKYTTPSPLDLEEEYEDEDSLLEDTAPARTYYEEDVSETYLTEQFPSKVAPTTQKASKNFREPTPIDTQSKSTQRNKSAGTEQRISAFNQRIKPVVERQTPSPTPKQQPTERQPINKPSVTENPFLAYSKQPAVESQTLPYPRQPVTERQLYNSERQQFSSERQSYIPERQAFNAERQPSNPERQPFNSERQPFNTERQPFNPERQSFSADRQQQFNSERQAFNAERQSYNTERLPITSERQPYTERQQLSYTKQPITERQPQISFPRQSYLERQPYVERQPLVERQPTAYAKPVTERLVPFQKHQITTERQIIPYVKLPVTDRQLVPFKQIVTERQIIPYLRQTEVERKPAPFPKQPPRSFEITAPGPSALGGRIEVSDSVPRGKYVIQGDRPTGFSLRLQQSEYSNPLQTPTQIQRRPEESNQDKIVTRPPFKPVRNYRSKPAPEPQYHDSVRLDSFPQRYLTGTEEYEPVVVPNPRLSVIPQIAHVSNSKEWYW